MREITTESMDLPILAELEMLTHEEAWLIYPDAVKKWKSGGDFGVDANGVLWCIIDYHADGARYAGGAYWFDGARWHWYDFV